jgi:hypothetical protein
MKNIKRASEFFKEISESVSAGNRALPKNPHLKNSYIFDPRLNYNHKTLIKDLYLILDKAVLTKTAVISIIERYTKEKAIESIAKLTKRDLKLLIEELNLLITSKENEKLEKKPTPDGKIHQGKCLNKRTKEKGDLYYDPLEKTWIFVGLEGEESVFETPDLFLFPKNS